MFKTLSQAIGRRTTLQLRLASLAGLAAFQTPVLAQPQAAVRVGILGGEIDANAFQHKPYLDSQIKTRAYRITPIGFTAVWPIGLYSRKVDSVANLPKGAVIGAPNDPSNEGRALLLLQDEGLITLREGPGILATVADLTANPRDIKIKELDAGIFGRSIDDLSAAVVNTDRAPKAGLNQVVKQALDKIYKGTGLAACWQAMRSGRSRQHQPGCWTCRGTTAATAAQRSCQGVSPKRL